MKITLNRVYNSDCIDGLSQLDAGSIDLAFADPPFNIGYQYDVYDDRRKAEDYLNWSKRWISGVKRVLKPNGAFWLAIGDEFAAELKILCTRDLGFRCRSWVVWFYTFGVHCTRKFTRSHAHLFHFVKDATNFTFNVPEVRVPSARQLVYGDKRAVPEGRMPDDTWMVTPELPKDTPMWGGFVLRPQDIPDRFPPHSDTWYFARVAGTFAERRGWHGCQMPEQLLGRVIRASSNEGDLVLDPFGGSGTTLAVARKLSRNFIGFELSQSYAKQIEERLKDIRPGDPLVGPENPERSSPRTGNGKRLAITPDRWRTTERPERRKRVSTRPIVARSNTTLGQVAVANREFNTAIAEAFVAAHCGYSADRVVADPELNDQYLANCSRLAIPGAPASWNRHLLNLRKQGGLKGIDTSRRTLISFNEQHQYIFASEIAWKIMNDALDRSLDDILADPDPAKQFDRVATAIAPGYSPFEYRWAALALRKMNGAGAKLLSRVRYQPDEEIRRIADVSRLPCSAANYEIAVRNVSLFVGFTQNLRECAFLIPSRVASAAEQVKILGFSERDVRVSYQLDSKNPDAFRFARRIRMVRKLNPLGNIVIAESAA